jgi:hypothetical protein
LKVLLTASMILTACATEDLVQQRREVSPTHAMRDTECWVRLHDQGAFTGNHITLYEDLAVPNLALVEGQNWQGRVQSIEVGPNARAILYGSENYEDRELTIGPDSKLTGFNFLPWGDVKSIRVVCEHGIFVGHNSAPHKKRKY